MPQKKINIIEKVFETILWQSRLIVLSAVIFAVIGAIALFLAGSFEIWHTINHVMPHEGNNIDYNALLIGIIGAIDLYLIGVVLLIFAFGLYELFISKIDIAREEDGKHNILEITSLDELKTKLIKVILMVLIVAFFKTVLSTKFQTPQELLYFAGAILCVAGCTFFIHRLEKE